MVLREAIKFYADDMLGYLAADEIDAAFCLLARQLPDEMASERLGSAVTSVVEERFARTGSPLRLALESGDPFLLRSPAARGFGAAILPRSLAELVRRLATRPAAPPPSASTDG